MSAFMERRAVATKAITVAARRFGVDVSDALALRERECVRARWTAWLALVVAGWRYEDIARMFDIDHTTIVFAKKRRGPELDDHIDAVVRALGAGRDQI